MSTRPASAHSRKAWDSGDLGLVDSSSTAGGHSSIVSQSYGMEPGLYGNNKVNQKQAQNLSCCGKVMKAIRCKYNSYKLVYNCALYSVCLKFSSGWLDIKKLFCFFLARY